MDPGRTADPSPRPTSALEDAAQAVRAEHRACSKSVLIRCHAVRPIGDPEAGLFALEVTRFANLDWTWEGARAFASVEVSGASDDTVTWSGEVVEVDDVASLVFVKLDERGPRPSIGDFVVQPFDYLEALRDLYSGDRAPLLARALTSALPHAAGVCTGWQYLWGPPGTGKTHTLGELVAEGVATSSARILVVSTTNRATDGAALQIGRALRARGIEPRAEVLRRVGSGADPARLAEAGLAQALDDDPGGLRDELAELLRRHRRATDAASRATLWAQVQATRLSLASRSSGIAEADGRIVVTTSFLGVRGLLREDTATRIADGRAPFAAVFVDEAGLISRVAAAALSLWARDRVVLVGDPRQLSPISRISRVLEPRRARWLARSGIEHVQQDGEGVQVLRAQYRMHPDVRAVVSAFAYDGALLDAADVRTRESPFADPELDSMPRAIWYVLDEDSGPLPHIRAERGPGGKSWVRRGSRDVMQRLFKTHSELAHASGMFVTPFVAQARELSRWFAQHGVDTWQASTTHAQQGAEADVVVFDTVHASSTAWAHDEWQRLINVGMSRARHLLIVLASRLEMREPYLRGLAILLAPRVLRASGGRFAWQPVSANAPDHAHSQQVRERAPTRLGSQLESRKAMRPILGAEQQRLCGLPIDGRPRLVRGVAGSGKTAVLAHWLARRVADEGAQGPFWVVYANTALRGLLQSFVEDAWSALDPGRAFPWQDVHLLHVIDVLDLLEREHGTPRTLGAGRFDFEARARRLLTLDIQPRCRAMFVDEAQDFGDVTLALLSRIVEPSVPDDPGARAMNIFYDNAQNLYGRRTPRWVDLGLDMQGRSSVMKESYRSTRPASEFALNVLYRLEPPTANADHAELVARDLIQLEQRNGRPWWRVRFNEVDGPLPDFRRFADRDAEVRALCQRVVDWIAIDGVRPGDIRVIANSGPIRDRIGQELAAHLRPLGAQVETRKSDRMDAHDALVLVTTAHSFKGHDAEIIAVPAADRFFANAPEALEAERYRVLASALYVALTRARSLLYVSCVDDGRGTTPDRIVDALRTTHEDQHAAPTTVAACTDSEEELELIARIGEAHRDWLRQLARRFVLRVGPILRTDASIAAEPVFHVDIAGRRHAWFVGAIPDVVRGELEELGVRIEAIGAGPG